MTLFVMPAVSYANTYQYIDTAGNVQIVEANSATQALAIAVNIGVHSGVMLFNETTSYVTVENNTSTGGNTYMYVDVNGTTQSVNAMSATLALANAPNIGAHSGVLLLMK